MSVIEHSKPAKLIEMSIFGVDASITSGVLAMMIAAALVFAFFFLVSRRAKLVPGPLQSIAEYLIEFIRAEMLSPLKGQADLWLPFIASLFSFIFVCNMIGLIPGVIPPTSNINTTATLAAMIFFATHAVGVIKHGLIGYLKNLVPSGLPLPVAIFLFPIEVVGQFARPFSLSVRLFANIFAGHTVMIMLISLIFVFKSYAVVPFPVIGTVAVSAFEIFVSLIQAFLFSYLSASYIVGAIQAEH